MAETLKTKGGESLMQSSLSGPLAEAVDIFHRCSLGEALTLENFHKLLQTSVNTTFPENYRIRMMTCVVEHAHKFPDSMGDTIQALLTILCEPSGNARETAVRSIPWLCRTINIDETRSRVVCELSDVLLQLCRTVTGPMEDAARKALNELLVLDSKAVVSKLFVWISDHRVDELDATVCAEEKAFATNKLKEILSAKAECLSPEAIQDLGDILKEKIRTVATPKDIRSVFKIFRSMKGFDDRQCARVLTTFLSECVEPCATSAKDSVCTPLQIITTLILCSPSAARRLDPQLVSTFVLQVCTNQLYQRELLLWECAATMGELISEECATTILPFIITVLLQQLHDTESGFPKHLSFIESLLGLFTRCVRKVPTALLKIIEQKNTEGSESQKLFESLTTFSTTLQQTITPEMLFAAKKHAIAAYESGEDCSAAAEAPVCIASLKSYLSALTASTMPKLPNPLPPLSWEAPWNVPTIVAPASPKRLRQK